MDDKGDRGMNIHIEYDDFGEYAEVLEEMESFEALSERIKEVQHG